MKVITAAILALEAPERWASTYHDARHGDDKHEITRRLKALTLKQRTPAAIAAIIGNNFWSDVPDCDECGKARPAVVQIGQEPDYESRTAYVCLACIARAHKALSSNEEGVVR